MKPVVTNGRSTSWMKQAFDIEGFKRWVSRGRDQKPSVSPQLNQPKELLKEQIACLPKEQQACLKDIENYSKAECVDGLQFTLFDQMKRTAVALARKEIAQEMDRLRADLRSMVNSEVTG